MKKILCWMLAAMLVLTGCNAETEAVTVSCGGPAPSASTVEGVSYDYTSLYLQVLEDLWNTDISLRNDIEYISFDLADAPGELTSEDIHKIAETFNQSRGAKLLFLRYQELEAQGYLTEYGDWENGVLLSIRPKWSSWERSPSKEHFEAEMYRASLGAYFFADCVPTWSETGAFLDYEILEEAIS